MVSEVLERVDEVLPVKQLLRWQDDGGALAPGTVPGSAPGDGAGVHDGHRAARPVDHRMAD